jgi:hypothetical protein
MLIAINFIAAHAALAEGQGQFDTSNLCHATPLQLLCRPGRHCPPRCWRRLPPRCWTGDGSGSGMGVMEMSHRGKEFISIYERPKPTCASCWPFPPTFASCSCRAAAWRKRHRADEPQRARVGEQADFRGHRQLEPEVAQGSARYCTAACGGQQCRRWPHQPARPGQLAAAATGPAMCTCAATKPSTASSSTRCPTCKALGCDAPLVIDFSSHVASRPVDWSRVGPGLWRRAEKPGAGRPDAGGGARRPAGPCPADLPQRLRLQNRGRQPVDVQHAADLGHLHRRA